MELQRDDIIMYRQTGELKYGLNIRMRKGDLSAVMSSQTGLITSSGGDYYSRAFG